MHDSRPLLVELYKSPQQILPSFNSTGKTVCYTAGKCLNYRLVFAATVKSFKTNCNLNVTNYCFVGFRVEPVHLACRW